MNVKYFNIQSIIISYIQIKDYITLQQLKAVFTLNLLSLFIQVP